MARLQPGTCSDACTQPWSTSVSEACTDTGWVHNKRVAAASQMTERLHALSVIAVSLSCVVDPKIRQSRGFGGVCCGLCFVPEGRNGLWLWRMFETTLRAFSDGFLCWLFGGQALAADTDLVC